MLSQIEQNSTTLKALRYRSQWQQLYAQAAQLRETVERYAAVFSQHNNADLLYKAYISGEMPLLNNFEIVAPIVMAVGCWLAGR